MTAPAVGRLAAAPLVARARGRRARYRRRRRAGPRAPRARRGRHRGVDPAVQRQGPHRLDAEVRQVPARREPVRHRPRRERPARDPLRQVVHLQRRIRPRVLQGSVLVLPPRGRVPLRRRAGARRARLGQAEQRAHADVARAADDAEGPGLPHLARSAAARRARRRQAALDRQPLHARHERRHERRAPHRALHQLDVEDLRRRPVGARGGARARRRARAPHRRGADRARVHAARRSAAATWRRSIRR